MAANFSISILPDACIRCGQCVRVCPAGIFKAETEAFPLKTPLETVPGVKNLQACVLCGHCVAVCPKDAVKHGSFRHLEAYAEAPVAQTVAGGVNVISPLPELEEPSWAHFQAVVARRRSVRAFTNQPVDREMLAKIVETGQIAPSARNRRGTHWTVVTDRRVLDEIIGLTVGFMENSCKQLHSLPAKILATCCPGSEAAAYMGMLPVMEGFLETARKRDMILHGAPALLVAHYDPKDGRFADPDAQLALQNATLAAVALRLGTFYTGYVTRAADSEPRIARALAIPEDHKIAGGMVVGHPDVTYRYAIHREYPSVMWIE